MGTVCNLKLIDHGIESFITGALFFSDMGFAKGGVILSSGLEGVTAGAETLKLPNCADTGTRSIPDSFNIKR